MWLDFEKHWQLYTFGSIWPMHYIYWGVHYIFRRQSAQHKLNNWVYTLIWWSYGVLGFKSGMCKCKNNTTELSVWKYCIIIGHACRGREQGMGGGTFWGFIWSFWFSWGWRVITLGTVRLLEMFLCHVCPIYVFLPRVSYAIAVLNYIKLYEISW